MLSPCKLSKGSVQSGKTLDYLKCVPRCGRPWRRRQVSCLVRWCISAQLYTSISYQELSYWSLLHARTERISPNLSSFRRGISLVNIVHPCPFSVHIQAGHLDNISRRFAYFKRLLGTYDAEFARVFPAEWKVGCALCAKWNEITRYESLPGRNVRTSPLFFTSI